MLAESSTEGTKAIANQYELVRATSDEERKRTSEALNAIYEQATGQTSTLFRQVSERFLEIVRQMKEMSSAMQREMESTRAELRKGILELPQETAESAANMRRVIVEQMDALAELNRIVARHSRDSVEPARRAEPVAASGGARAEARPARFEEPRPARFEERVRRTLRGAARAAYRAAPAPARGNPPPRRAERRPKAAAAAGCPICSAAPGARSRRSPRPTSGRPAAPWSRSTPCRSISPA